MVATSSHPDTSSATGRSARTLYLIERIVTLALLVVVTWAAPGRSIVLMTAVALGALVVMRLASPLWVRAVHARPARRAVTRAMAADAAESLLLAVIAMALALRPLAGLGLAGTVAAAWWIAAWRGRTAAPFEAADVHVTGDAAQIAADHGFDPDRIVVDRRAVVPARLVRWGGEPFIILSPRVVDICTPAEQAVVVAHELGHAAHHDLRWTVVARTALISAAVLLAGGVGFLGRRGGLDKATAVAVSILALGVLEVVAVVALAAMNRATERRAHRWALAAVGDGDTFAAAMRKVHALSDPSAGPGHPTAPLAEQPSLADVLALANPRRRGR